MVLSKPANAPAVARKMIKAGSPTNRQSFELTLVGLVTPDASKRDSILKQTSSYSDKNPTSTAASTSSKKIVFADEQGLQLVENKFAENLFYSENATSAIAKPDSCCTLS